MVLFTAIIGHNFSEQNILTAAGFLNMIKPKVQPCLSLLDEHLISMQGPIEWQWYTREGHSAYDDIRNDGNIVLNEVSIFSARISKRLFCLYCGYSIRWIEFLRKPLVNEGLRCLCKCLALELDSNLIIYVPDSGGPPSAVSDLLYTEDGIESAEIWLRTNCGAPAEKIENIFPEGADVVDENGYFIEVMP